MDYFFGNPPEGDILYLTGSEMHHCLKVLRHKKGDQIGITDGKGNLWVGEILEDNWHHNHLTAKVMRHEVHHGESSDQLTLVCCGPEDVSRMEWLIEKAVELGVNRLYFTRTQRSGFLKWKEHRLNTLIRTALKQCGRTQLPDWEQFESLSQCLEKIKGESGIRIVGKATGVPIKEMDLTVENQDVIITCGPEGDFTESEYDLLALQGFQSACLGKTRLRSETACMALVSWVISRR
jgi:16S rRNA (uracil1498-N3)-methyltransferase